MNVMFPNLLFETIKVKKELRPLGSATIKLQTVQNFAHEMLAAGWITSGAQTDALKVLNDKIDTCQELFVEYARNDPRCLKHIVDYFDDPDATKMIAAAFSEAEREEFRTRYNALRHLNQGELSASRQSTLQNIQRLSKEIAEGFKRLCDETLTEINVNKESMEDFKFSLQERRALRQEIRDQFKKADKTSPAGSLMHEILVELGDKAEETQDSIDPRLAEAIGSLKDKMNDLLDIGSESYGDLVEKRIRGLDGPPNYFEDAKSLMEASGRPEFAKELIAFRIALTCFGYATVAQDRLWEFSLANPTVDGPDGQRAL